MILLCLYLYSPCHFVGQCGFDLTLSTVTLRLSFCNEKKDFGRVSWRQGSSGCISKSRFSLAKREKLLVTGIYANLISFRMYI